MSRFPNQGTIKDGNGRLVTSATVTVYEAGTTTPADVYEAESGGSQVNFVTSDSTSGIFIFWIDEADYGVSQNFKIIISKSGYTSQTYDDIFVERIVNSEDVDITSVGGKTVDDLFDGGYDVAIKPITVFGGGNNTAGHVVPNAADDVFTLNETAQTLTNKTLTSPTINSGTINTPTINTPTLTTPVSDDLTITGTAASPPDANTITKESLIKAWVRFDGIGTVTKENSFNVASITDNGTGDYTIVLDTDMSSSAFAAAGMSNTQGPMIYISAAVGSLRVNTLNSAGAATDADPVLVILIGDQ